jgi:hypothetical protein
MDLEQQLAEMTRRLTELENRPPVTDVMRRLDAIEKRQNDANAEIGTMIDGHPAIGEFREFLSKWGRGSANA